MSYHGKLSLVVVILLLCTVTMMTVEANPDVPSGDTVHVVATGETLWGIAQRYGVSGTALQEANSIADPDQIRIGQQLIIPGVPSSTVESESVPENDAGFMAVHVVAGGETLNRIAARYGTTSARLAAVNGLADPNHLFVGQRLLVPGDAEPAIQVGFDGQGMPWPFASVEMRSPEPVQGDTVLALVETVDDVMLSGSFEGQEIKFANEGQFHWGLIPIHAMAGLGSYDIRIKATMPDKSPVSIVGQIWVKAGDFEVENIILPPDRTKLLDRELIRAERARLAEALETTGALPIWGGLFIYPVANPVISSEFGSRRSYNDGPATSFHEGIDFDASESEPVMVVADGQVVMAEPLTVRGDAILIDHGLGIHTGYWHLSEIDVEAGQQVKAGDVIGKVGSSGLATGPHLHWEIRIGQINVNPKQWTRQTFP